jgi:hypothetical protein
MTLPMMTSSQPPSPRVQELGQRIALAIAEFQQRNPDLTAEEVRAAAQLATQQVDAPRGVRKNAAAAAAVGVAAVGLGAWLATGSAGGHLPLATIGGLIAALVVVFAVANRRS